MVIKCPVIKLNRAVFTFSGALKLIRDFFKGMYILRKNTKSIHIDLIHSNAISVLVGAFYGYLYKKKHIWHVHEIIEHPRSIANFYPKLVYFFSNKILFNSKASYQQFYKIKPEIAEKSKIAYNGQSRLEPISDKETIANTKQQLFKTTLDKKVIGLVGRISRWKGQILLLDAFHSLKKKHADIHLVFVGSAPPGQDHFLHNLRDRITELNLNDSVSIVDFQKNIWPVYDAIDISVVPSTEPEPFGLVATEAMLSHKPLIASDHGGLSEIVVNNETGFLFEPRNQSELELKIEALLLDPALAEKFGENGFMRVQKEFSTESYVNSIESAYREVSA